MLLMTKDEVNALRERLSHDEGFTKFMTAKRAYAQKALNQCAKNHAHVGEKDINQIMADYSAIVRLYEELILPEKQ